MLNTETRSIQLKNPLEIAQQSYGAEIVKKFLYGLPTILPTRLREIDIANHLLEHLAENNCSSAMRGYKGFPSDVSISKNNIVTHGIPSTALLKDNDVITVDVVCKYQEMYSDMSYTYGVGKLSEEHKKLLAIAWKVCKSGLCAVKIGNTLRDVAIAIRNSVAQHRVFLYQQFVGHGIGRDIHELPYVHYHPKADPIPIKAGMVLCIEPIISLHPQKVVQINHSYLGKKMYPTAVYEHMVGVFEQGAKVLSYDMAPPEALPSVPPQLFSEENSDRQSHGGERNYRIVNNRGLQTRS